MREAEKNMWTAMNNSLFGRLCMNLLNFKSTLTRKLPSQQEKDKLNKENIYMTGSELTLEYLWSDVDISSYCF